jgi:hypothetical protein
VAMARPHMYTSFMSQISCEESTDLLSKLESEEASAGSVHCRVVTEMVDTQLNADIIGRTS